MKSKPLQAVVLATGLLITIVGNATEEDWEAKQDRNWVNDVFDAIDSGNVDAVVEFMSEDVLFRHGNQDPLHGKEAVREALGGLFESIEGISHELSGVLVEGDSVVVYGEVTYTRQDGSTLTVPVADVWSMAGSKIKEYLIFVDNTEL